MDSIIKYEKIKNVGRCVSTNLSDDSKSKSRRAVSWAPDDANEIYEIPHINDFSSEMIDSLWYNEADYQRIQTSCIKIIRKMVDSDSDKQIVERTTKRYCSRGLEHFTDAGALARRTIRRSAIDAVMDEQFRQFTKDVVEPACIADLYAQHCRACKYYAIITALRDELESMNVEGRKKKIDCCILLHQEFTKGQ
jgi:hypothetical protein